MPPLHAHGILHASAIITSQQKDLTQGVLHSSGVHAWENVYNRSICPRILTGHLPPIATLE